MRDISARGSRRRSRKQSNPRDTPFSIAWQMSWGSWPRCGRGCPIPRQRARDRPRGQRGAPPHSDQPLRLQARQRVASSARTKPSKICGTSRRESGYKLGGDAPLCSTEIRRADHPFSTPQTPPMPSEPLSTSAQPIRPGFPAFPELRYPFSQVRQNRHSRSRVNPQCWRRLRGSVPPYRPLHGQVEGISSK